MVVGLPAERILRGTAAAMVRAAAHCTIKPSSLQSGGTTTDATGKQEIDELK